MRQLKFRAWYWDTKVMEYPSEEDILNPLVIGLNGTVYQAEGENLTENTAQPLRVFPKQGQPLLRRHKGEWSVESAYWGVEIMQFTGLRDKNGKDIYEGDLMKVERVKHPMVVEYDEMFGNYRMRNTDSESGFGFFVKEDKETEVIGNIYENPELLEK